MDESWLSTVRIAREIGDISSLFPKGITRLWDLPYTIFNAVGLALYYLSFSELPEHEQPPRKIWEDPKRLEAWFREVKANRESESKGDGSFMDMPQNQLIKEMFGGKVPGL